MMPVAPSGQFEYPEQGWSTGNMRMAKRAPSADPGYPYRELESERKKRETKVSQADQQYPMLEPQEWQQWFNELPSGGRIIVGNKRSIQEGVAESPQGITIRDDHPGLKSLSDDYEVNAIPEMDGHLLVRPKRQQPLVS